MNLTIIHRPFEKVASWTENGKKREKRYPAGVPDEAIRRECEPAVDEKAAAKPAAKAAARPAVKKDAAK